ncbi:MAG: hypothetical protein CMJ18_13260 [Phycisphaeraceae bacterium]|nr:hypothetical protein [Phycisphaeraceae bacterium]
MNPERHDATSDRNSTWQGLEALEPRVLLSADPGAAAPTDAVGAGPAIEAPAARTVQYRESDFSFVTRLLEQEGIFLEPAQSSEHAAFMPEIEDEVVLGFLNGDPRHPVVLGMRHDGGDTNGGGYDEIALDDSPGHESTDRGVTNNETIMIGHDRTRTTNSNATVTVNLLRTHSTGVNEAINVGA